MPKFLSGIIVLLLYQLAGEILSRALSLPLPGPVLAMVALCASMVAFPVVLETVRPVADGLLQHLSLLFVPVGVGAVARLPELSAHALALTVSLVGSTLLAIIVGAVAFEVVARATNNVDEED